MLTAATIDSALRTALDEDAPWGDITGEGGAQCGIDGRSCQHAVAS